MFDEYVAGKYRTDNRPSPESMLSRDKAAIVGVGHTQYSQNSGRDELDMAVEAIKKAVDDAGLKMEDIDGLQQFSLERTSVQDVIKALGIKNLNYNGVNHWGGGGSCCIAYQPAIAVATGMAKYVVGYRSMNEASGHRFGRADGYASFLLEATSPHYSYFYPFGFMSPLPWIAMRFRRWMDDNNIKNEHMGWIPTVLRENAQKNPDAIFYGKPYTYQDWLENKIVCDPMRKYDCSVDSDGAVAIVVTTAERARDCKQKPAYILAGAQSHLRESQILASYNYPNPARFPHGWYIAQELFRVAGITPQDIDVAQIYDANAHLIAMQLEEMGFCEWGESGEFVNGGDNIRVGGKLPVNTAGGMLSEAYIHGVNLIVEAVRQIRGTACNQVPDVELSLMFAGGGLPSSGIILRR